MGRKRQASEELGRGPIATKASQESDAGAPLTSDNAWNVAVAHCSALKKAGHEKPCAMEVALRVATVSTELRSLCERVISRTWPGARDEPSALEGAEAGQGPLVRQELCGGDGDPPEEEVCDKALRVKAALSGELGALGPMRRHQKRAPLRSAESFELRIDVLCAKKKVAALLHAC